MGQPSDDDILEMESQRGDHGPASAIPQSSFWKAARTPGLAIWIGFPEARAIALEMEGVPTPRPLNPCPFAHILTDLNVKIVRIIITDIQDTTFMRSSSYDKKIKHSQLMHDRAMLLLSLYCQCPSL